MSERAKAIKGATPPSCPIAILEEENCKLVCTRCNSAIKKVKYKNAIYQGKVANINKMKCLY